MKRKLILSMMMLLALSAVVIGQSGRPGPEVTINVTEGPPIKGRLIRADIDSVVLNIGAGEATIKTANVTSIEFDERKPRREMGDGLNVGINAGGAPPENVTVKPANDARLVASEKVISALRRLDNAIDVGVMLQNYSQILIDSKTIIDEELPRSLDGTFQEEALAALIDHQFAMTIWNMAVANNWNRFHTKMEPGRTLVTKYGVPMKIGIFKDVPVDVGRSHVWLAARAHYNQAVQALKKAKLSSPA